MKDKHAALPWTVEQTKGHGFRIQSGSDIICWEQQEFYNPFMEDEAKANAEFIVQACNAHYDLLNVAKCALADLEGAVTLVEGNRITNIWALTINELKQAITKATE